MGVGAGLYMCDVVKKSSRSLSHLLMSSCFEICEQTDGHTDRQTLSSQYFAPYPGVKWKMPCGLCDSRLLTETYRPSRKHLIADRRVRVAVKQ